MRRRCCWPPRPLPSPPPPNPPPLSHPRAPRACRCARRQAHRALATQPRTFEAAAFDHSGRLLLSDWLGNRIDVLDAPGATPRTLATVEAPGGLAPMPDGTVLAGSGIAAPALLAPAHGFARLMRLDPDNGTLTEYASGLSMGNGVVRAPDGADYTSNDLVPALDRVDPDGTVHRGWYRETTANGLAVSPDGKTLYANVSLGDTRILAIDIESGEARTHYRPPAGYQNAFRDDLDIDAAGRLYAPLYFAGQVLRVDTDGTACTIASGLTLPAGITVGVADSPFAADSVFVTTHAGQVVEIPHAVPAVR
ncbi:SMP-30/gluconolactonase/LRE family protein [Nocardia higoensis]|uniref:SMP-30/gluconolactonase/LRE family protein n=1 Tax=Nocardia higoensis TaxID=228599 RepID=A0ABS0D4D9_9NOCA|nr:SMP-30/gluconolactonase/LRE family protein [Nocardia higoensis]MBF6353316.1 SMP-30/gluconolactonase/LRE family protein [Nocardia higoensis]